MTSCDVIITQPNNVPFPLWSKWMNENAHRFQKIYIALHNKNMDGYDFTALIIAMLKNVKNVVFIEGINPIDGQDWRNVAINRCLNLSTAENVLFMEQDIFFQEGWLDSLHEYLSPFIGAGYKQGSRFHPSFLLVKRSEIEKTSKDFSPIEVDHFGKFSRELQGSLFNIDARPGWFHMNGLTQNYTLVQQNQSPNHDLANFLIYNRRSREVLPTLGIPWEDYDAYVDLTFKAEKLACPILQYLEEYT